MLDTSDLCSNHCSPWWLWRRSTAFLGVAAFCLVSSIVVAQPTIAATEASKGDGSRFGLAKKPLDPAMQELYDYAAKAKSLTDATFEAQTVVHRAHTVMLAEQGILTKEDATTILKGLTIANEQAAHDPALRAYMPYETALIEGVGAVAGKMHIGRSRNDLANTINRMYYREQINVVISALNDLRSVLVDRARANLDTVMPVYTHRKQAQPITLAHYLMAHAESIGKSVARYEDLYARVNLNPLGAAASAGSGFPLDRNRTTELLGFDGLVVNTIEGVAGWDHIAEFAAANAIYMANLSRLASEMQNWQTDEFDMIELDGGFAGTSSIMPQKKNPTSLEYTRRAAAETMGDLVGILASLDAIEYQHSVARVALEPRSIDRVLAATHAMAGTIRTMTPKKERMRERVQNGFSTMTELTDTLVRESGLSFREAHDIIAHVVEQLLAQNRAPRSIDVKMIQAAAVDTLGRKIQVTPASITAALDVDNNVSRRNGIGGPAPDAVRKAIDTTQQEIAHTRTSLEGRRARLAAAASKLTLAERSLFQAVDR